jgi:hypothetical protein
MTEARRLWLRLIVGGCPSGFRDYFRTFPLDKKLRVTLKKFLHLWKFAVISSLRTNFAAMLGIAVNREPCN